MRNIDLKKLPKHIAIIMDGNGRWAQKHALGRIVGHRKGAEAVRATVKICREIGIKYLTLYAFSVEVWLIDKYGFAEDTIFRDVYIGVPVAGAGWYTGIFLYESDWWA